MRSAMKFRTYGVIFLVMILAAIWFVYAVFNQTFTRYAEVSLQTDHVGLQLPDDADVKVRGEIIGQVRQIKTRQGGALLTLGLKPNEIGSIPANATAEILPKTLFGEKYVSLVVPKNPSAEPLRRGTTIKQTKLPIEVEKVLSDIYPLLRTVQPAQLNYTLNALATALEGRGDELGHSLQVLDSYLVQMNPEVPQLVDDLTKLGQVSDIYSDVLPQLASTLRNTITTTQTLQGRQARLNQFLKDTTAFSNTATTFLDANGDNIVQLGQVSEPTTALLARYSAEFPCLLNGIVNQAPKLGQTFRNFIFHIQLKLLPRQPRGYKASDKPVFGATQGPYCGTLPNPPFSESNPFNGIPNFDDGVPEGNNDLSRTATRLPGDKAGGKAAGAVQPNITVGGTGQEKALMTSLAAPVLGKSADQVGDITTLLFGPLARGTEVSYSQEATR